MEQFENKSERLKPRVDNVLCVGLLSWEHISGVILTPTNRSHSRLFLAIAYISNLASLLVLLAHPSGRAF